MRIGIRKSPHLETVVMGILACGDTFTSEYDTGADFWLVWGWPQAEQVERDGADASRIICIDAHPFALALNDKSGARIFQLGNWGALAKYPPSEPQPSIEIASKATPGGPVLVLGQVRSTEQKRLGLVDVWHTEGCDAWTSEEVRKPNRKFREHPREHSRLYDGVKQPTLAEDLEGCSSVVSWNSTAAIHAQLLGYPATAVEPHGWAHIPLNELAASRVLQPDLRSGKHWNTYRTWLKGLSLSQ